MTLRIEVRNEHHRERGTFFVVEGKEARSDGSARYWCQLTCNTPFGVVGTYFGSMGAPAATFLRSCNKDYILGRLWGLETEVYDGEVAEYELRRRVLKDRKNGDLDSDDARRLMAMIENADFEEEHGFRTLVYGTGHFYQMFSEGGGSSYKVPNPQAEGFWEQLWPGFIEQLTAAAKVTYADGPVWDWFGLSYGNYFAAPRRSLQSMPLGWQQRFVELMDEAAAFLPSEAFPDYTVTRKSGGRYSADPLSAYKRADPIPPKEPQA